MELMLHLLIRHHGAVINNLQQQIYKLFLIIPTELCEFHCFTVHFNSLNLIY